ncbi:unnamed protein product, partial [Ectocarpus sp. 8 AP-2014]
CAPLECTFPALDVGIFPRLRQKASMHAQKVEGTWSATGGTSRTTVVDGRTQHLPSSSTTRDTIRGEGITGCCSVYSSVLRVQRSLAEDWSDISDDGTHSSTHATQGQAMNKTDIFLPSKGRTRRRAPRDRCQSLATKEDEETQDNRAAYQRFFASVVDSTDKLDRLLASLDTPSRPGNAPSYSGRKSSTQDIYFSGEADNAVQFNTKEEATEWEELAVRAWQLVSELIFVCLLHFPLTPCGNQAEPGYTNTFQSRAISCACRRADPVHLLIAA